MRLDKYLAQMSMGTRSEVKKFIKSGRVFVNGIVVRGPQEKVNPETDVIALDGQVVCYQEFEYYMLHKPQGVVSATVDRDYETVVSLIQEKHSVDLFPVGRLDRDTEGLLLLTNDGALAHQLLSPKKHVDKTYLVHTEGVLTAEDVVALEQGVNIGDEKVTLPAKVKLCPPLETGSCLELTIQEGRFHQIKRMLKAVGKPVIYLKRLSMGGLVLDEELELGAYRHLTKEEVTLLKEKSLEK